MDDKPQLVILEKLTEIIDSASHGERLPTVRDLMKQYRVGQATVQEAFAILKKQGLISAQVGRGSYVIKATGSGQMQTLPERSPSRLQSLLILSNSSMNERCALVQNLIVEKMKTIGGSVMQISYHDIDHLLLILKSIPTFDAIVMQSHYENIPVRLLAMLQAKSKALVLDGHTLSGVDIDRIGVDWSEALGMALDHLTELNHREIALVSLDSAAHPILSARRLFDRLTHWQGHRIGTHVATLPGIQHPTQGVSEALARSLDSLRGEDGRLTVTAVMLLGVSDGMGAREVLEKLEKQAPGVSVVLLGHPDVPTEHLDYFSIAGGNHTDGANALYETVQRRLLDRLLPPQIVYLSCQFRQRPSSKRLAPDQA